MYFHILHSQLLNNGNNSEKVGLKGLSTNNVSAFYWAELLLCDQDGQE